jgi:putative restriction endonuclease
MATGRLWTAEEIVRAILLYCETPFGQIHDRNPSIIALAKQLGRTPGSVGLKLANLASLDESIDRTGMRNASRLDRELWITFFEDPEAFLGRALTDQTYDFPSQLADYPAGMSDVSGEDIEVLSTARKGQKFFRKSVLASFNSRCCITSIQKPELLNASHIIPWSTDKQERLNPANGLCLNALHDRAFDRGLITLDDNFRIVLSKEIRKISPENFERFEGCQIELPDRFLPSAEALRFHRNWASEMRSY